FCRDYRDVADWAGDVALEPEVHRTDARYDALQRIVTSTTPDGSAARPGYNRAGLLERLDVQMRGETDGAGEPVWTPFVHDIDYDAKGRREQVIHANGAATSYEYDPLTFRLTRLSTAGPAGMVQDLRFTYDPAGNIIRRQDDAQQAVFFRNHRVDPSAGYIYDATYQLVEASGREHLGQNGPIPSD